LAAAGAKIAAARTARTSFNLSFSFRLGGIPHSPQHGIPPFGGLAADSSGRLARRGTVRRRPRTLAGLSGTVPAVGRRGRVGRRRARDGGHAAAERRYGENDCCTLTHTDSLLFGWACRRGSLAQPDCRPLSVVFCNPRKFGNTTRRENPRGGMIGFARPLKGF
jgi:hypothetical protein